MSSAKKKILIVAGEASGDLHGSGLARSIIRLCPDVQVYGVGNGLMRQAGVEMIIDSSRLAVVGITEVFSRIGSLLKAYRQLKKFIRTNHLALLVLIDFPDFNLLLAREAKRAGVPVLYYISPQVWAWRSGRVHKIASRVNKMAVILPFEVSIYKNAGLDAEFVGHPLLDVLDVSKEETSPVERGEWRGNPLIAILPGSRTKEVKSLLPSMARAAGIIMKKKPGARFILPIAPTLSLPEVKEIWQYPSIPIEFVEGQTYQAIKAADLAIVASGTATLETAILNTPMVIVYHVSPVSYWVGRALVKVNWVGLVNIVAGRGVVPELLQKEANGERIAAEALKILDDESYRKEMIQGLAEVRGKLGTAGAAERVAKMALEMIGENFPHRPVNNGQ